MGSLLTPLSRLHRLVLLGLCHCWLALLAPPLRRRDDRGDVPGWVLVTVVKGACSHESARGCRWPVARSAACMGS